LFTYSFHFLSHLAGGALSYEKIAEILDLDSKEISGRHWKIFGCSAVTGDGLIRGFDWIVNDITSRIFMMN